MRFCLWLPLVWLLTTAVAPLHAELSLSQLYETYVCSSFPDVGVLEQPGVAQRHFPDYLAASQTAVEYEEAYYSGGGGGWGFVTCTSDRDGYASLIYFGADGLSRIIHQQLPLRARQPVTLSARLPAGVDGVTLLLLWSEPPDHQALAGLAVDPNASSPVIHGVRESYWLRRARPEAYLEPWRDPLRPLDKGDTARFAAAWPWCSARMTAGFQTVAKDCAIDFSGLTGLLIDEYGARGQWRLDWGSELTLYCELPVSESWSSAELWLYGNAPLFSGPLDLSVLELEINGWPVRLSPGDFTGTAQTQHIALELRQYLHGGSNRITMRLSSLASSEWLIHGIEVWMY